MSPERKKAEIVIAADLLDRLFAEVRTRPDREVCGLLFGTPARIEQAQATANVAPDPATAFEVDPAALLAAHKGARAGKIALIGNYHSHPSGQAIPSARDAAAAEPGGVWLILTTTDARAYRANSQGFEHLNLIFG